MKLFLDTNFIMEFVEQRKQFDKVSIILDSVFSRKNEAYISTGCMYTLAFLFEQNLKRQDIHADVTIRCIDADGTRERRLKFTQITGRDTQT